jgi:hypothetical protein
MNSLPFPLNSGEKALKQSMGPPSSRQNRNMGMALADYVTPSSNMNGTGSWMDRQLQEMTPVLKGQLEFLKDIKDPKQEFLHGN